MWGFLGNKNWVWGAQKHNETRWFCLGNWIGGTPDCLFIKKENSSRVGRGKTKEIQKYKHRTAIHKNPSSQSPDCTQDEGIWVCKGENCSGSQKGSSPCANPEAKFYRWVANFGFPALGPEPQPFTQKTQRDHCSQYVHTHEQSPAEIKTRPRATATHLDACMHIYNLSHVETNC